MSQEETGSIVANVKVTHDTPDLEAGNNNGTTTATATTTTANPLQALQQHSAKFHDTAVRPLLAKAGASFKQAKEVTVAKSKELGQHLQKAHAATTAKSKELGAATVHASREIGAATVTKTRELSLGTSLAAAATVAHTKHTLAQIGSHPTEKTADGETVVKGQENDFLVTGNIWSWGIQGVAVIGGIAALITMLLMTGQLIDIASFATILLAPLVFWQKMQLNALGGMRAQQNALRTSVNRLTTENGKLADANTQLEAKVDGLKDVETKLNDVAMEAGAQVDRLVNVVSQNGELQKKIMSLLEDEVVQSIMTAIITTDRDGSFTLDRREVYQLEMRLAALPAVHFDKQNFRDFLASDQDDLTLTDLTHLVKNLKSSNVPDDKKIFHFVPTDILEEVPPPVEVPV